MFKKHLLRSQDKPFVKWTGFLIIKLIERVNGGN